MIVESLIVILLSSPVENTALLPFALVVILIFLIVVVDALVTKIPALIPQNSDSSVLVVSPLYY